MVSVNALVLRAAALVLRAYLHHNASFSGKMVRRHGEVQMSFARVLPEGRPVA